MRNSNTVVALFDLHTNAEAAVKGLQRAGFDMKKLSIIGKDYHTEEHVVGFVTTGDRAKFWGKLGAFWGGLWGVLFGSAALFVFPGIGHLIVLGPLASAILGGLEGAALVGGVSALAGALGGLGIPKNSVLKYERALKAGKFALIAHGTEEDATLARRILEATSAVAVDAHGETGHVRSTG